ncbi:MAG: hypothetical protein ACFE68_06885 [Candidatus Hodarchaeota archaeon]
MEQAVWKQCMAIPTACSCTLASFEEIDLNMASSLGSESYLIESRISARSSKK